MGKSGAEKRRQQKERLDAGVLAKTPAGNEKVNDALDAKSKKARLLIILTVAGVLITTGVLALLYGRNNDKDDGKGDDISAISRKVKAAAAAGGPLTPQQAEEAIMELERLGLGKVYWKEPVGNADPAKPPHLSVGFMHGDHFQGNTEHAKVMRRTVLTAKHLRNAGFPMLGMEGTEKGKTVDHQQMEINDRLMPWAELQNKLFLKPAVARELVNQRVDLADVLNGAMPPNTWVGIEPADTLARARENLPKKQKLDDIVHGFLGLVRRSTKNGTFHAEFLKNNDGSIRTVIVGGESFDANKLRAELDLWRKLHRDDYSGKDAQDRNAAFAGEENPVFVGTGHLLAVQDAAVKGGRKAGVFLPEGTALPPNGVEGDIRVVTIGAVLDAMDQHEKEHKK